MLFVLTNAQAAFQRALDIILAGFKWHTCLFYLVDIIVFSQSKEEHLQHVAEVLNALEGAGVTLKLAKCSFSRTGLRISDMSSGPVV